MSLLIDSTKTQDQEFQDLAQTYTGSLNDMQKAFLHASGLFGSLADMIAAYIPASGPDFASADFAAADFATT